ncbi:Peptidyl-prolyl cis-trans isomerase B [Diplonema papillatum]|nr:Peptidyl-prolyl cis-trans isomerase B [Diplonema papillatum]
MEPGQHRWRQTQQEVEIIVAVPKTVRGKQVKVEVKDQKVKISYPDVVAVEGSLFGRVVVDDMTWDMDDAENAKLLRVTIPKAGAGGEPWTHLTKEAAAAGVDRSITHKVFLDVRLETEAEDEPPHRIVLGLFGNVCPRTAENFRCLCTGEKGGKLHYKNTRFHKAVSEFLIEGGDVVHGDGTGGSSIYGDSFDDENFIIKHDKPGILGAAAYAKGGNKNHSAFYITLGPKDHMDNRKVAFGEVLEGLDTVELIAACGAQDGKRMEIEAVIVDCGELPM